MPSSPDDRQTPSTAATKNTVQPSRDPRTISPVALEKLRQTIIECFSEGQFHEVGIREICQKAKVSPQTVYKYFGSKEELMYACVHEEMNDMNKRAIAATQQAVGVNAQIIAFTDVFYRFYGDNPAIARIVFLNIPLAYWVSHGNFIQRDLHQFLYQLIASGQQAGIVKNLAPADLILEMIMGASARIIVRWLTQDSDKPLSDLSSHFVNCASHFLAIDEEKA